MPKLSAIDPVLALLFIGMVLFTVILITVDIVFKGEGQIFQVISSLVAGFAGAFFTRLKPQTDKQADKMDHPDQPKVEA